MGMSASSYNLLRYTSRKNDIGYQLTLLSNQKVALSRDMQKVSKNYQEALNAKTLKWSNNAGVSYIDLTYKNLMTPSTMNQNTAYLLTDSSGKVVIDSDYQQYAEMISPDGSSGGDYESNRTKILSSLTGIDAETIENGFNSQQAVWENEANLANIKGQEPDRRGFTKTGTVDTILASAMGSGTGTGVSGLSFSKGSDWSTAYKGSATISLGTDATTAKNNLSSLINNLSTTLSPFFMEDAENFTDACTTVYNNYAGLMDGETDLSNSDGAITSSTKTTFPNKTVTTYTCDVKTLIDEIFGAANLESVTSTDAYGGSATRYTWYDIQSNAYKTYQTDYQAWEDERDSAQDQYDSAVNSNNQLLTAEQESLINYYDSLFSSVAEKGWTYNNQVNDADYLNQMLQNNLYTITTVQRDCEYDCDENLCLWSNNYSTDIASNCTNIYTVNDSDARDDALVEYEYQKSIINAKETRIDTRMQNLETEQSAINQMIQGIESVRNDNIERTFSVFS